MAARAGAHAIVLAAGAGRRFGGRKLLADWRGEPLIRATARIALAAPVESVVVVTGADGAEIAAAIAGLDDGRLRPCPARDWALGLSASLRAGVAALPADARSVVVFLGDMPLVPPELAGRLLAAVAGGAEAATVVSPLGPAHPVAFARSQFAALGALDGDRGARGLLAALGDAAARIESADPGVVFDIDAPSQP